MPRTVLRSAGVTVAATALALVLIAVINATSFAANGWSGPRRVIDGTYREVSMDVDSNGKVHAAARGDSGLWYLTNRTGDWTRMRVTFHPLDGEDVYPSLDVDDADRVHIAFSRHTCGGCVPSIETNIYYVSDVGRPAGTFDEDPIWLDDGDRPSLVVVNDARYLAYQHIFVPPSCEGLCGEWEVLLRTDASGPWTTAVVEKYATRPSLAIASNGRARVAYEGRSGGIKYAIAGTSLGDFSVRRVTFDSRTVAPRLALDEGDRPHIAWTRNSRTSNGGGSYYAKLSSGTWVGGQFTTIKWDVQLAMDGRNRPQLAVLGPAEGVHYYRLVDGSLKRQTLSAAAIATSVAVRIGGNGKPVVLYTTDGGVPDGVYHARKT